MPWMHLTCGACGHEADLDEFTRTPIGGALPKNIFQCPRCHIAIEKRHGPARVLDSGFVMPGKVELVRVQASL
jgi:hypothetical protein